MFASGLLGPVEYGPGGPDAAGSIPGAWRSKSPTIGTWSSSFCGLPHQRPATTAAEDIAQLVADPDEGVRDMLLDVVVGARALRERLADLEVRAGTAGPRRRRHGATGVGSNRNRQPERATALPPGQQRPGLREREWVATRCDPSGSNCPAAPAGGSHRCGPRLPTEQVGQPLVHRKLQPGPPTPTALARLRREIRRHHPLPNGLTEAEARGWAVRLYQAGLDGLREAIRTELAGKDLACWCPPGQPCHADALLQIANSAATESP